MYGLPSEKVKQEGLFQGGKYCDWGLRKTQEITPLLAKRTGRPVRMACTRKEMYDFNMNQRFSHLKVGFKNNGLITAIDDFSIADAGVPPVSNLGTSGDQGYGPYFTTRCLNIKQTMEVVNSNRGKMYTSGQHCPFNWDSLTMAIQLIAEKLGKDPIDIATLNLHGPTSDNRSQSRTQLSGVRGRRKEADELEMACDRRKKTPRRENARRKFPVSDVPAAFVLGL